MIVAAFVVHPITSGVVVGLLTAVLATALFWKEYKSNHKFPEIRLLAVAVALLALLGLALRPAYQVDRKESGILLLTRGYARKTVDSLIAKNPSLQVFVAPDAGNFPAGQSLTDWTEVEGKSDKIRFVSGTGIPSSVLERLQGKAFTFLPSGSITGVTTLSFPAFFSHRPNILYGKFSGGAVASTLILEGPGGVEDSVTLQPDLLSEFRLSFFPRQPGHFLYRLRINTGDSSSAEMLPLEIQPEKKINVLFLQRYPSAETKYLKNYLGDRGHSLVLRYQVSQKVYRYEYVNHAVVKGNLFNEEILRSYDLIITEHEILPQLSAPERKLLEARIHDGLGMIVTLSDPPKPSSLFPFAGLTRQNEGKDTVQLQLESGQKITLPAFTTIVKTDNELHPLTKTTTGKWTSAWRSVGTGKIGVQLLQDTWSLALKGKTDAYAAVWAPLIEQVAAAERKPFNLKITTPFPLLTNDPIRIEITTAGGTPRLFADRIPLALTEDAVWDDVWEGSTRVAPNGWHELMIEQDSSALSFYTFGNGAWHSLTLTHQLRENSLIQPGSAKETGSIFTEKGIPLVFFFAAFVLAMGFLWLVPKL